MTAVLLIAAAALALVLAAAVALAVARRRRRARLFNEHCAGALELTQREVGGA